MNPLILIAGVFLFVSGIMLGRQSLSASSKTLGFTQQEAPTATPSPSSTPETTSTPSATPTIQPSVHPTTKPTATPQPSSSANASVDNATSSSLNDFKYPGSSTKSETGSSVNLSSNDDPSTITTWYENKIKQLGYSSQASAKTNTNGNITNKLGGGKNGSSVNITIQKKAGDSSTSITITTGTDSGSDVHIKIENNQSYL